MRDSDDGDADELDPEDFVRAMLHIGPEGAAKVRERTPGTRQRPLANSDDDRADNIGDCDGAE